MSINQGKLYVVIRSIKTSSWKSMDNKKIKPVNLQGNQPWILLKGLMLSSSSRAHQNSHSSSSSIFGHLTQTDDSLEKSLMLERLRTEGEEGIRGRDGWMASPMQWTWTWVNFRRCWGTGRPGMLQSMGTDCRHNWLTYHQQQFYQKEAFVLSSNTM